MITCLASTVQLISTFAHPGAIRPGPLPSDHGQGKSTAAAPASSAQSQSPSRDAYFMVRQIAAEVARFRQGGSSRFHPCAVPLALRGRPGAPVATTAKSRMLNQVPRRRRGAFDKSPAFRELQRDSLTAKRPLVRFKARCGVMSKFTLALMAIIYLNGAT